MSPRPRPLAVTVTAATAAVTTAALALAGCGSDAPSVEDRYCSTVRANLAALETPAIATPADVEATLAMYRSIAAGAPLAVQPEWEAVVASLETASTVDPGDPASVQLAADTVRRSDSASTRIQQYTNELCAVEIGEAPPATNPVTATTVPVTEDSAGE